MGLACYPELTAEGGTYPFKGVIKGVFKLGDPDSNREPAIPRTAALPLCYPRIEKWLDFVPLVL